MGKKENKKYMETADIVLNSLKIFSTFKKEFESFKKVKKLSFEKINLLGRDLFDLKGETHRYFREYNPSRKKLEETDIFDLIVSSIFHEVLHLKEFIYVLEKYEPRYLVFEKKLGEKKNLDPANKDFLRHSRETVGEAKLGLPLKLQGVNELVNDALPHLASIIEDNAFDKHLIRTLFVYSDYIDYLFPQGGIKRFYNDIYEGGWIEGLFLVGESFSKSGFYEQAELIFKKILEEGGSEKTDKITRDYLERSKEHLKTLSAHA